MASADIDIGLPRVLITSSKIEKAIEIASSMCQTIFFVSKPF